MKKIKVEKIRFIDSDDNVRFFHKLEVWKDDNLMATFRSKMDSTTLSESGTDIRFRVHSDEEVEAGLPSVQAKLLEVLAKPSDTMDMKPGVHYLQKGLARVITWNGTWDNFPMLSQEERDFVRLLEDNDESIPDPSEEDAWEMGLVD